MADTGEKFSSQLVSDIIATASKFQIPVSEAKIRESVTQYQTAFFTPNENTFVQFRVAKKPKGKEMIHQLNWRSEVWINSDEDAKNLLKSVRQTPHSEKPATRDVGLLIDELTEKFPTRSIALDFDPLQGMVKLWHFGRHKVEDMFSLSHVPPAVAKYRDFFQTHDFFRVFCTGVDFEKESMNIYFMFRENHGKGKNAVTAILNELKFELQSESIISYIATHCSAFALTFSWTKDTVERICFYSSSEGPAAFAAEDKRFVEQPLESRAELPMSFVGCSFGGDFYTKLETDYYNSYYEFLQRTVELHLEDDN